MEHGLSLCDVNRADRIDVYFGEKNSDRWPAALGFSERDSREALDKVRRLAHASNEIVTKKGSP